MTLNRLSFLLLLACAPAAQAAAPTAKDEFFRLRAAFENSDLVTNQEQLGFESNAEVLKRANRKYPYVETKTLYACEAAYLYFDGNFDYRAAHNTPCNGICPGGPTGYDFMYNSGFGRLAHFTIGRQGYSITKKLRVLDYGNNLFMHFRANWSGSIVIEITRPVDELEKHGPEYFDAALELVAHSDGNLPWGYIQCRNTFQKK